MGQWNAHPQFICASGRQREGNDMSKFYKGSLLATTVMAGLSFVSPAYAQDAASQDTTNQENAVQVADPAARVAEEAAKGTEPAEAQEITVTGSRFVRRDLESAAPVAVVQDEEFKLSGSVNVESVINTLPQVVPGATAFSNNPGGGVATLNLRGVGSTRTLVLVNGKRWMFFDTSQRVDLNTIPSFLLDSVDVVTGGASAVYGSDAIAGVVNFRLRNDLNGIEVGGQYSITGEGDGARYNSYIALGGDIGDRGHATVYGEYYNRGSIFQGARDFSAISQGDDGAGGFIPGGSGTLPEGRLIYAGNGNRVGTDFATNRNVVFDAPGDFRPRVGSDLYNYAPANYLMVPQERYLVGGYADYDVGNDHTAYTEVSFVNNRVANELAATPVTGTFNVNLAAVQPFLNASEFAQLQQLDATETVGGNDGIVRLDVRRRVTETGARNTLDERNAFRLLTGMRGPITDRFSYDVYYSYARTRNANIQRGNISQSAFQRGLDGTDPAINVFGPNTLTPDMVNQITIVAQNGEISVLQVANASVAGSLFNFGMGADDVGIAFGAEYRKMKSEFIPDTALSSGDVIGFNAGLPTKGQYDVREGFAEIRIPIAARVPFAYKAELSGAARYSDYSLGAVGGVWTYSVGAEYAPVRDVTLRGQYQRAVRAPNVGELFGGRANGFPTATDPCSELTPGSNPTLEALCIATGVPAAQIGQDLSNGNTQFEGVFGGNPDLQEETSDSYTAGLVFRPTFFPGFSATVDYYNIKLKGAVGTFGGGFANALNLCYNEIQDINSSLCQVFIGSRNSLGELDGNPPLFVNANTGKIEVTGVDLQLDYGTKLPFTLVGTTPAKLNLFFLGTYTKKSDFTAVQEFPDQVTECAGKFGTICGNPTPKYKFTSRASLISGPLTTSLRWRHLSSVKDDDDGTDYTVEKLKAYNLFDLSAAFDVTENLSLAAGVNNLFDKTPQIIGDNQEQANTYPSTYDVLGRDFFVSANLKF
jgi:outer membrane receptor protein involved in Fe transport